jgi:hypothetical protein
VRVGADLHVGAVLALVAEGVHVPDDREGDLTGPLGQLRDRPHGDHLVHGGGQRDRGARHLGELRAPDAAGDHDGLGLDVAAGGAHPADTAFLDVHADHLDGGHDGQRTGRQRRLPHERARPQRVDHADRRAPERSEDLVLLQERDLLDDEVRADQMRLDAPRAGGGHAATQLLHPLLGAGDLEAAGLGEHAELLVLAHRVLGQIGHLAGVVDREDEVRRVPGGAAGVGQRALVDLDDVAPPEPGEMVHEAVADDAGADHDDAGGGRNGCHRCSLLSRRARAGGGSRTPRAPGGRRRPEAGAGTRRASCARRRGRARRRPSPRCASTGRSCPSC